MSPPPVSSSQSYDATTHFESTVKDVISMYCKITGKVIPVPSFEKLSFIVPLGLDLPFLETDVR